jgi:drug/metabolite transporter (DMT)-like permease
LFSLTYYLVAASSLGFLSLLQKKSAKDQDPEADKFAENLSVRGGLELGTYLFLGNGLQVLGLKTVNSDRAAFLLQLTTIFVPLIQGFLNGDLKSIPQRTWTACFVALLGVAVISLDGKEGETLDNVSSILANFSEGDLLVMAAAFSYSFHCIRLERFARQGSAVRLAACKAFTETSWNISLLAVVLFLAYNVEGNFLSSQAVGNEIVSFVQTPNLLLNPNLPSAVIATLWTGLVTVAYTIYAQSFGQARISPTDANLIYTIQPVCTAIFAWILLGETVGPLGFVGGLLIGSAVYMVAAEGVNNQFQSK